MLFFYPFYGWQQTIKIDAGFAIQTVDNLTDGYYRHMNLLALFIRR